MRTTTGLLAALSASALLLTACSSSTGGPGSPPDDGSQGIQTPTNLTVPFDMGGGTALAVNALNDTLVKEGLISEPLQIDSRPGASGIIGMTRVIVDYSGDDDQLLYHSTNVLVAPLLQNAPVTYADLTPIARVFSESEVLLVAPDSPFDNLDDIAAALQGDIASVTFGGGTKGNADHQAAAKFAIEAGATNTELLKYVPYDGADSTAALLGGHIDVLIGGPDLISLDEAGEAVVLGITAQERLSGDSSDIPTFLEQGYDVTASNSRFIFGPPDMPAGTVSAWQDILTAMTESSAWQQLLEDNTWSNTIETTELLDSLQEEERELRTLLGSIGLID